MSTISVVRVPRVLVVFGSRHGATQGIAERVATVLREEGLEVALRSVAEGADPGEFDAVVIGSAVYAFHWLKEPARFVRRNSGSLATRPVWLFSSGPLKHHPKGEEARALEPKEIAAFDRYIHPREHRVFAGAFDSGQPAVGLVEHLMRLIPAARKAMPGGDFRDWDEVERWGHEIARQLLVTGVGVAEADSIGPVAKSA